MSDNNEENAFENLDHNSPIRKDEEIQSISNMSRIKRPCNFLHYIALILSISIYI